MNHALKPQGALPPVMRCLRAADLDQAPAMTVQDALGAFVQIPVHELKCWAEHFGAVWSGHKRAELRRDDRGFATGDALWLRERVDHSGGRGSYTGRAILARITHIVACDAVDRVVPGGLNAELVLLSVQIEGRYTA